ncbi:MAG TPA: flagellar basal body P-ring protein FlgI [Pirellulales bacterium]
MRPGSWILALFAAVVASSCAQPFIRSQSPEPNGALPLPKTKLVGDYAVAFGMFPAKVEGVAWVTGLPNTGSDPEPGPYRDQLLSEMKTNKVHNPNDLLASNTASLVLVRGFLRPGIQEGDHFDIEVRVPSRSGTTSLRDGWLMPARLTEMAVLQGAVHEGHVLAIAQGPLMVDPEADKNSQVAACRGRVLGGGVARKSRPLALVLKPDHQSVAVSSQIGQAINRRFHTFVNGVKQGVANPKDDEHVDLIVHSRYKDNVERYMKVIRSIAMKETAGEQATRLVLLEKALLDPMNADWAALQLEAIGKEAAPVLLSGLKSTDAEVRFYAAEALAYLDFKEAAAPLAEAARDVPAFRAYALAALSAMDDFAAADALRELLELPSNETRYGAFRALWAMNSRDALVRGENLGDQFSYHVIDSIGPPLVHVTRNYRPEVVLFGQNQRLTTPFVLESGRNIMLNGKDDRVTISRFVANEPDQKRVVSTSIDEVIRALVELGATYPDIVQVLQNAKSKNVLPSRLAIDAVPSGGRKFDRSATMELAKSAKGEETDGNGEEGETPEDPTGGAVIVRNPLPGLFDSGQKTLDKEEAEKDTLPQPEPKIDKPKWSWTDTMEDISSLIPDGTGNFPDGTRN